MTSIRSISTIALCAVLIATCNLHVSADGVSDEKRRNLRAAPSSTFVGEKKSVHREDDSFWRRILAGSTSVPTAAPLTPTPRPTTSTPQPTTPLPSSPEPTPVPTTDPTASPPTLEPTFEPTSLPPTPLPTSDPATSSPTQGSTFEPTSLPPTPGPTSEPITSPPTLDPTFEPTSLPPTPGPTSEPMTSPPTLDPTFDPTSLPPTPVPTPMPATPMPTLMPTTVLTQVPTFERTSMPTTSPTPIPNTLTPTTMPSTEGPTSLTIAPSAAPSLEPTPQPSALPTPVPPTPPPTPTCIFESLSVTCSSPDGDCSELQPPTEQCRPESTFMKFQFNGGDCSQSNNTQPGNAFQCFEFDPPIEEGEDAFVTMTGSRGQVYFEGVVQVGDFVDLENGGDAIGTFTLFIRTYRGTEAIEFENNVQTVIMSPACVSARGDVFLEDKFGSFEVVEFASTFQPGVTSVFAPASLNHLITASPSSTNVELLSLTTLIPTAAGEESPSFDVDVTGLELTSGEMTNVPFDLTLDTRFSSEFSITSKVEGQTPGGSTTCSAMFDDGSAPPTQEPSTAFPTLEGTVEPTLSPTTTPTVTGFTFPPTIDPTPTTPPGPVQCAFESLRVTCSSEDGNCAQLQPSTERCQEEAVSLIFQFLGGDCSQSDNLQPMSSFQCVDFGPAIAEDETAFVTISGAQNQMFFQDTVRVGDSILVTNDDAPLGTRTIFMRTFRGIEADPNQFVQSILMDPSCTEDIFLEDVFGSFEVEGFGSTSEQGFVSVFSQATLDHVIISSPTSTVIELVNLTTVLPTAIDDGPVFEVAVTEVVVPPGEMVSVPLAVTLDTRLSGGFSINSTVFGESLDGRSGCAAGFGFTNTRSAVIPPQCAFPRRNGLTVNCLAGSTNIPCHLAVPSSEKCASGLDKILFELTGGTCAQSSNLQERRSFLCDDLGPPHLEAGETAFVEVTDNMGNTVYNDTVQVGGMFTFSADSGRTLNSRLTVSTYRGESPVLSQQVQRAQFDSSCDGSPLMLQDRYGVVEVLAFTTPDQATLSVFELARLDHTITAAEESSTVELLSLTTVVPTSMNGPSFNLKVAGDKVLPGSTFSTDLVVSLDMRLTESFSIDSEVVGSSGDQNCSAFYTESQDP